MINSHYIITLATFAFASSITPGANNLMLMTSGVHFGLRQTLPHMFGVAFGFMAMMVLVGLGLGELFKLYPILLVVLKYLGAIYIIWLAYKITQTKAIDNLAKITTKPMRFLAAVAFQWVNPKAWMMGIYAITAFTVPEHYSSSIMVVSLIFGTINLPCITCWTLFGVAMRRFLNNETVMRRFNYIMAALLIASLWPVFMNIT